MPGDAQGRLFPTRDDCCHCHHLMQRRHSPSRQGGHHVKGGTKSPSLPRPRGVLMVHRAGSSQAPALVFAGDLANTVLMLGDGRWGHLV